MSNLKTAGGAMIWLAVPILMALVALEPVQAHHGAAPSAPITAGAIL